MPSSLQKVFLVKNKPNDNSQTRQAGHSEVALNGCVGPEEASNGTLACEWLFRHQNTGKLLFELDLLEATVVWWDSERCCSTRLSLRLYLCPPERNPVSRQALRVGELDLFPFQSLRKRHQGRCVWKTRVARCSLHVANRNYFKFSYILTSPPWVWFYTPFPLLCFSIRQL